MELAEGIRRIGFRRWYERQLIESHLYLVSFFLCLVAVLACYEGFSLRGPGVETALRFVAMFAGGAVCAWSLRRYLAQLTLAMRVAERSVCGRCKTFGALEAMETRTVPARVDTEQPGTRTGVRCRKCGNEWTIE